MTNYGVQYGTPCPPPICVREKMERIISLVLKDTETQTMCPETRMVKCPVTVRYLEELWGIEDDITWCIINALPSSHDMKLTEENVMNDSWSDAESSWNLLSYWLSAVLCLTTWMIFLLLLHLKRRRFHTLDARGEETLVLWVVKDSNTRWRYWRQE